jgi:hypothetical protein
MRGYLKNGDTQNPRQRRPTMIPIDSYGWIEYFLNGPLADKYGQAIEAANETEYVTPIIVVYEVYKHVRSIQSEQAALEAAEISLTNSGIADAMILLTARTYKTQILTSDKTSKITKKHSS